MWYGDTDLHFNSVVGVSGGDPDSGVDTDMNEVNACPGTANFIKISAFFLLNSYDVFLDTSQAWL